jgi:hypothetical protein
LEEPIVIDNDGEEEDDGSEEVYVNPDDHCNIVRLNF